MDPLRHIPRLTELSGHLQHLPVTDRGTFTTFTSIPDIQAWTTAKADEYRQFALALLAIHNLAAPIHRLPTEVLEQILEQCWQDRNSLRLPHVCRLWRSILLSRPVFWADAVEHRELVAEQKKVVRNEVPLITSLISRSDQRSCTVKPSFYTFPPSLAKSIIPHVSNVASLQVAVGLEDLRDGLWPVLVSGMPNLEALVIQLTVMEEDLSGYNSYGFGNLSWYYGRGWRALPLLSGEVLPKLSRVTCPYSMISLFGNVPLRHVRAEWIDRSPQCSLSQPRTVLGPLGLHLEPFRDTLETLEITLTDVDEDSYAPPEELPVLRYLHITSYSTEAASGILSWLSFPQTAFIHIALVICQGTNRLIAQLRPIVRTVDRVCLEELEERVPSGYFMQCFTGDVESLRIDEFDVRLPATGNRPTPPFETLLPVFGEAAPVTHLILSPKLFTSGAAGIDLYAFPHLLHLDVNVADMNIIAIMMHPDLYPHRRPGQTEPSPTPCPRLAELVVTSPSLDYDSLLARQSNTLPDSGTSMSVDELFHEELTMFQRALAHRASRGATLTYLALTLRLATIPPNEHESYDGASDTGMENTGDMSPERPDSLEQSADDNDLEDDPDIGSDETMHERTVEFDAMWPSYTARQLVLERLQELVDGPVVMKLLDSAGGDVDVDEPCEMEA